MNQLTLWLTHQSTILTGTLNFLNIKKLRPRPKYPLKPGKNGHDWEDIDFKNFKCAFFPLKFMHNEVCHKIIRCVAIKKIKGQIPN